MTNPSLPLRLRLSSFFFLRSSLSVFSAKARSSFSFSSFRSSSSTRLRSTSTVLISGLCRAPSICSSSIIFSASGERFHWMPLTDSALAMRLRSASSEERGCFTLTPISVSSTSPVVAARWIAERESSMELLESARSREVLGVWRRTPSESSSASKSSPAASSSGSEERAMATDWWPRGERASGALLPRCPATDAGRERLLAGEPDPRGEGLGEGLPSEPCGDLELPRGEREPSRGERTMEPRVACADCTSCFLTCWLGRDGTGGVLGAEEVSWIWPDEVSLLSATEEGRAGTAGEEGAGPGCVEVARATRRLVGVPCVSGTGASSRAPTGSVIDIVFERDFLRWIRGDFEELRVDISAVLGSLSPSQANLLAAPFSLLSSVPVPRP
mmetsp:Transcript_12584/g.50336  ORF Transcript_12584/g.50336 Transcript_12584/m.50336 type:complete len:387 (-) Transcript_12584:44-1204(-)